MCWTYVTRRAVRIINGAPRLSLSTSAGRQAIAAMLAAVVGGTLPPGAGATGRGGACAPGAEFQVGNNPTGGGTPLPPLAAAPSPSEPLKPVGDGGIALTKDRSETGPAEGAHRLEPAPAQEGNPPNPGRPSSVPIIGRIVDRCVNRLLLRRFGWYES